MLDIKAERQVYSRFFTYSLYALAFLFMARLVTMSLVPLNDSTEARYGEIARKMLETGNWVTPQHDYGVPFWAKPPLSTWLSAFSMKCLGVNEFAARFPEFLLSLGVLWLVWGVAKKHSGSLVAMYAVLVLSASMYFFLDAGAVMTDPSLLFCTTLAMVAFWCAINEGSTRWAYLFFVALGLGLLAKGPIALVLVGLTVFFWVLLQNKWLLLWKRLPWASGTLLTALVAFPWYFLAERRTPGFLNYFIVGEHVHRFLTPGWTGDKYGMAHHAPWGMIWIYAAAGIFPWSILGCFWLRKHWRKVPFLCRDNDGWMSYLLLGSLLPLVFFTFSSNIIYPYVIPALPAFAILFAEFWHKTIGSEKQMHWIPWVSVSTGFLFLIVSSIFVIQPEWVAKTHKPIIKAWQAERPQAGSHLVYWDYKTQFSAQFYSAGKAKSTQNIKGLCQLLSNQMENYLIIDSRNIGQLPDALVSKLIPVKSMKINGDQFVLYHASVLSC